MESRFQDIVIPGIGNLRSIVGLTVQQLRSRLWRDLHAAYVVLDKAPDGWPAEAMQDIGDTTCWHMNLTDGEWKCFYAYCRKTYVEELKTLYGYIFERKPRDGRMFYWPVVSFLAKMDGTITSAHGCESKIEDCLSRPPKSKHPELFLLAPHFQDIAIPGIGNLKSLDGLTLRELDKRLLRERYAAYVVPEAVAEGWPAEPMRNDSARNVSIWQTNLNDGNWKGLIAERNPHMKDSALQYQGYIYECKNYCRHMYYWPAFEVQATLDGKIRSARADICGWLLSRLSLWIPPQKRNSEF